MEKTTVRLQSFGLSDIGISRKKNEDFFLEDSENFFFALADGMGGHKAGEIAAKKAVRSISTTFLKELEDNPQDIEKHLYRSIEKANKEIFTLSRENEGLRGMGTTFCCLFFYKAKAVIAHVGDSRIYRLRNEELSILTEDHSLIFDLLQTQHLEKDEPMPSPYKNVITKALGPAKSLEPEVSTCDVRKGDIFLLCSDGLTDFVSEKRIKKTLQEEKSLQDKVKKLITIAKQRKSQDNITLILIKVL